MVLNVTKISQKIEKINWFSIKDRILFSFSLCLISSLSTNKEWDESCDIWRGMVSRRSQKMNDKSGCFSSQQIIKVAQASSFS